MPALDRRIVLAWVIAVLVLAAFTAYSAGTVTHGFVAYYAAARLLITHQLGPIAYDDVWFGKYVQELTGSIVLEIFTPNPPTMALMAAPIAMLEPGRARTIWLVASLAAMAAASLALIRFRASAGRQASIALVFLMLLNPAVFANLRIGQGYLFVFALMTATALLLIRGREVAAGACLGLLLGLKASGAPLLLLLVATRRYRAAATAVGVAAGLAVAITPWIDPRMWLEFPLRVREFVERPSGSVTAYQTTLGLFRHLCVADPRWNPSPAADCATAAVTIPPSSSRWP